MIIISIQLFLEKLCRLYFKYIYIISAVFVLPVISADLSMGTFEKFYVNESSLANLSSISGAFIGFLLTIGTIIFSMSNKSKFMEWFSKKGHHKILFKIILYGIIFYFITIFLWILGESVTHFAIYSFILGCIEVINSIYYLKHLIIHNFDNM